MNIDINKMFKDKNKEIFKNSLTLEMERNLDTLKNTTDNCVALEINKLFLFFKKYFHECNISFKKEELLGFLYKEKTSQKPKGQRCIIVFKATICYSVFAYHLYMCYEKYY